MKIMKKLAVLMALTVAMSSCMQFTAAAENAIVIEQFPDESNEQFPDGNSEPAAASDDTIQNDEGLNYSDTTDGSVVDEIILEEPEYDRENTSDYSETVGSETGTPGAEIPESEMPEPELEYEQGSETELSGDEALTVEEIPALDEGQLAPGTTKEGILGTWEGSYTGYSNSPANHITRNIKVGIDVADENGNIEGYVEIDGGSNGVYYFTGTVNYATGKIAFKDTEWIDNPEGFDFSTFDGTVFGSSSVSGCLDGDSGRGFELKKTSDKPFSCRISREAIPQDWGGEYDGYSGDVVVRRNYSLHITEIKESGEISGTAVISPSSKAPAALGANGSYKFRGKIDFKMGKISELQGYEWIEYPVGGSVNSWEFVRLEGRVECADGKGRITGKSENGVWEMSSVDYDSFDKKSGFTLGRDNNSYTHSNAAGGGFANVTDYTIDQAHFDTLTASSSPSEKNKIKKLMNSAWTGSCYGIAATMGLVYEKYLSLDNITSGGASSYYTMPDPCKDKKLLNTIQYYYLSQFLSNGGAKNAAASTAYRGDFISGLNNWKSNYDSLPVFLRKLVTQAESNHIAELIYVYPGGGHAVLATGCSYNKETGKYEVEIYDMDSVSGSQASGAFTKMSVNPDYSGFDLVTPSGDHVSNSNYWSVSYLDWHSMAALIDGTTGNATDRTVLDLSLKDPVEIKSSDGGNLVYDGTKLSGSMSVYDADTIESGGGSRLLIYTDGGQSYTVTPLKGSVDMEISSPQNYLSLEGSGITSAAMDMSGSMKLDGTNYSFKAYMSADKEVSSSENGLMSAAGTSAGSVSLDVREGSLSVSADQAIKNLSMGSYEGTAKKEKDLGSSLSNASIANDGTVTAENLPSDEPSTDEPSAETHEHKWGEWKVARDATALKAGERTRSCSVCGEKQTDPIEKLKAAMKLNVSSITLQVKQSTSKVKVSGLAKGDSVKSWKSAKTSIVTVNKNGKIKAKNKTGSTTVTVTLKSGLQKKIKVKVQKGKVTTSKIRGINKNLSLEAGETTTLKPQITPITSSDKVTYSSSNKKVATVNNKGKITAKKKGKTTVTVKSGKKKVTCKVTVK